MKIRTYILGVLSFAMATFLLIHFAMIIAYGKFYIYESNGIVLISEVTLVVAILSFSFYCIVEQLRSAKADSAAQEHLVQHQVYIKRRG
jgi:hypothetical protein